MDPDIEFICPRPRNTKACDNCRARKIRCLPGERVSAKDTCRRCAKLGYSCTYVGTHQSLRRKGEKASRPPGEDVISRLFQNQPQETDKPSCILDLHRRVFHDQVAAESRTGSMALSFPEQTPQSTTETTVSDSHVKPTNTDLSMEEAETLVSLFRLQKIYFPFVDIPDTVSAASLASTRPFLLLAILTVSSSRTPHLQKRTDERFRRVLSERVVLHGEKSLDFVQGLLVYVAWYPFHLRPMQNQISQFLQIATTMISDLRLTQRVHEKEVRNALLGCHHLPSLLAGINQRSADATAAGFFDLVRDTMPDYGNDAMMHLFRHQMLVTQVMLYKPSSDYLATAHAQQSFYQQLEALDSSFPAHAQDNTPFRLTTLFLKTQISYLPLKPLVQNPAKPNSPIPIPIPPSPSSTLQHLEEAESTFSNIQTYLEAFLSLPTDQYIHFSMREWCQLILTFSIASRLCFSPLFPFPLPSAPENESDLAENEPLPFPRGNSNFQASARAKMLIYLESLAHRMGILSVSVSQSSNTSAPPDLFCMFKSVLEILAPMYAPPLSRSPGHGTHHPDREGGIKTLAPSLARPDMQRDQDQYRYQAPCQDQDQDQQPRTPNDIPGTRTTLSSSSSSRCPVLNGSIQQTDFWRALDQSQSQSTSFASENVASGNTGYQQSRDPSCPELSVDDLLDAPQDWASLFAEWVVDLQDLPE